MEYIISNVPGDFLRFIFGFLVLGAAVRMAISRNYEPKGETEKRDLPYIFWGFATGFIAGLLGIGGGIIMVPVLSIIMGFSMRKVIGTTSAVMVFTSIGGNIGIPLKWCEHHGTATIFCWLHKPPSICSACRC